MANKRSKLNSYKRLLHFLKPYIKLLIISIICMVAVSASNLYVPWIIKDVIDKVLEDKDLTMLYLIIISIIVIIWSLVIHNLSFPNICSICCIWILSDIRQYLLYYIENNTQKQYTVHELLMCFLNYF